MQDERTQKKHKQILGTVEVRRGKLETLNLGVYDKGQEPAVIIELEPKMPENITVNRIPLLLPGNRVELRYQFQNYGSTKCRVTALADG